jgi:hypothetical protein
MRVPTRRSITHKKVEQKICLKNKMRKNKIVKRGAVGESQKLALHYMKTLVDVALESFLILDSKLRVISANPIFYRTFRVLPEQTEGQFIYDLGNGQWDIPLLKSLLEKILPEKKIVENYEVNHTFQTIGEKTILLNAKQVDSVQLIILAMEDITDRKEVEQKKAEHAKELEAKVSKRTKELADRLKEVESLNKTMIGREIKMVGLKKEIENLKKLVKNGTKAKGNHKNG